MHPPISHRYLAIRSGIGHFGDSGNIITNEYGSAIVLASVVTDAELIPTDSLPEEENCMNLFQRKNRSKKRGKLFHVKQNLDYPF